MNKKANVTLMLVFFILTTIIIMITAVFAPFGVRFSTQLYEAGEGIINQTQPYVDNIQDANVKSEINDITQSAKDATVTNVQVSGALFKYSWLILAVVTFLVIFISSRQLTETGRGGFV